MAWQDLMLVLARNFLQVQDVTIDQVASSPYLNESTRWENALNYYPSRPLRFATTQLAQKDVRFIFSGPRTCDSAAAINVHTNFIESETGGTAVEQRFQWKIVAGTSANPTSTTVADWHGLNATQSDQWGHNIFRKFNSVAGLTHWTFSFRAVNPADAAQPTGALSVGCILLGQQYQFPENPLQEHVRSATAVATVIGRPFGTAQFWQREDSIRRYSIGTFHLNEDSRVELERLIAGRGRRRFSGTEFARKRMDIPVALIGPEMWFSTSSNHGGCVFGRFTSIESRMRVGEKSVTEAPFEEVV